MKRPRTPKRTRTTKNKSIKVKRRLGGANANKYSNSQDVSKSRRNIGIYNTSQRPHKLHKLHKLLLPSPSSTMSPHTTSTSKLPLGKLVSLAALVSLGNIQGSHAFNPNQDAIDCVRYNGNWDSTNGQCTNKGTIPSTKSNSVIAGTNCVIKGNSWTSNPIGRCHGFLNPKSSRAPGHKN